MSVNSDRVKKWRIRTKERLLSAFGGKCGVCGYNKCSNALEFHHLDPTEKEFALSERNSKGKGWKIIVSEIKKCVLLCSNCHKEFHSGLITIPKDIVRFDENMVDYKDQDITNNCPVCGTEKPASEAVCSKKCRSKMLTTFDWENYNLDDLLSKHTRQEVANMIGCSVAGLARYRGIQKKIFNFNNSLE